MLRFALGTYFYLLENECKAEGDKNCVDPDTVSSLGWLPLVSCILYNRVVQGNFAPEIEVFYRVTRQVDY